MRRCKQLATPGKASPEPSRPRHEIPPRLRKLQSPARLLRETSTRLTTGRPVRRKARPVRKSPEQHAAPNCGTTPVPPTPRPRPCNASPRRQRRVTRRRFRPRRPHRGTTGRRRSHRHRTVRRPHQVIRRPPRPRRPHRARNRPRHHGPSPEGQKVAISNRAFRKPDGMKPRPFQKPAVCLCILVGVASASLWPAGATVTTNVFFTRFEAAEGYVTTTNLVGQNGWLGFGSGGNGLVSDYSFTNQGQQAYIGYFAPGPGDDRVG